MLFYLLTCIPFRWNQWGVGEGDKEEESLEGGDRKSVV